MQETDPHARILKESANYFGEYTCLQIIKRNPFEKSPNTDFLWS